MKSISELFEEQISEAAKPKMTNIQWRAAVKEKYPKATFSMAGGMMVALNVDDGHEYQVGAFERTGSKVYDKPVKVR